MNFEKDTIINALKERGFYDEGSKPFIEKILNEISEESLFGFFINGIQQAVLTAMLMDITQKGSRLPRYESGGGYDGSYHKKDFQAELAKLHNSIKRK